MDLDALATLRAPDLRAALPGFLASYIDDEWARESNRERVETLIRHWSDADLESIRDALGALGDEPRKYPAHPKGRGLSRTWCRDVISDGRVHGAAHLAAAAAAGPTLVVCNHLAYVDSQAIDAVLAWGGHGALADRLVSLAGPKVYADLFRRIASLCLGTLPVPQSTSLGHAEKLSPRELARQARASLDLAHRLLDDGDILLLYAEGSRSRTTRLQAFLPGTARYLRKPGLQVVPAALVGTHRVMPVGEARLRPGPVRLTFGEALLVDDAGSHREALAAVHDAVAALLPDELRPLDEAIDDVSPDADTLDDEEETA